MLEKITRRFGRQTAAHSHGSSLDSYRVALDQERAASMADEGGASGAHTDMREQLAAASQRAASEAARYDTSWSWKKWLLWTSAIAIAVVALAGSSASKRHRLS